METMADSLLSLVGAITGAALLPLSGSDFRPTTKVYRRWSYDQGVRDAGEKLN
jgi:hypothetical protein